MHVTSYAPGRKGYVWKSLTGWWRAEPPVGMVLYFATWKEAIRYALTPEASR